jgi:hypothetical protein
MPEEVKVRLCEELFYLVRDLLLVEWPASGCLKVIPLDDPGYGTNV